MTTSLTSLAQRIIAQSWTDYGAPLRAFGGIALEILGTQPHPRRPAATDIDLVGRQEYTPQYVTILQKQGFEEDQKVAFHFGQTRRLFRDSAGTKIELFFDPLLFARPLRLGERLCVRVQTLSVADLLLTKLLIHEFSEKDLLDVLRLLDSFCPGASEEESTFEVARLVEICTKDWGSFQLLSQNILLCEQSEDTSKRQQVSLTEIMDQVQEAPKTLTWKLRSMIGSKMRYWNHVDPLDV